MSRWVIALLCVACAIPSVARASRNAPSQKVSTFKTASVARVLVAPADEYFGPTKMSVLGIRNTIQDTQIRASGDPDHQTVRYWGTLSLAERALNDWAAKYPHDTWIPRNALLMARLFDHMHTADGDAAAASCRAILFGHFSTSWFAQQAHHDLELAKVKP